MSPIVVGTVFGLGVFCIYWSFWPQQERPAKSRDGGVLAHLRDHLTQAGYAAVTPGNLVVGSVVLFVLVFLGVMLFVGVVPIALSFALMAGLGPVTLVRSRARARRNKLRDLWPDAVDNITSGIRAGLALPEALAQLAVRGPEELRPAFAAFAEDYRTTGRFHDCLDRLKERLRDPVADRLVESLRIAREVGGSELGTLLRTLSAFLREDARTRSELETRQSWTVGAARLAVAAPWVVLGMLAMRGQSLAAYSRPVGWVILLIGAVLCVVAYRIMVWIGRLPEEERVLR
ncbi:type II secretion system protein F [Intrasporangium chromatireducens Q5-1]|uniref:Type II secretion system protein F n=1 Tax=Intrasporangium chromatireducens Q5-1 TaxID=584657 RepID=W9GR02_9MICO|nr:type II secretion system F family protein [Intrasporangium chromatireducens]EWT06314.1 type II secretion system protein F [Intrasporangium chromatireducens Q5-1]